MPKTKFGTEKLVTNEVSHQTDFFDKKLSKKTITNKFGAFFFLAQLDGTARYAGLLLAPAEGFSLRPRLFLPFGQKKSLLCCFGPFLAIFGVH